MRFAPSFPPQQLTFGKEYTAAVEAKQVAQQDAERAKFIVRHPACTPETLPPSSPALGGGAPPPAEPRLRPAPSTPPQVEKAEQDKKSAIIRAEGEAKSAQLLGDAIQSNPSFLILRRIEAAREIAGTISNSANRVVLNADSLMLNLVRGGPPPQEALHPFRTQWGCRKCTA